MPYYDREGYLNPLHIVWRKGDDTDPYIDKAEFLLVANQTLILSEIPDRFQKVKITGLVEINADSVKSRSMLSNEFYVDYSTGVVRLHKDSEGKTVNAFYKGRGFIQYPADRIYYKDGNNNVVGTLSKIIDESNTIISEVEDKLDDLELAKQDTIKATQDARLATDETILATEETKIATEKALDAYETTRLVFKPYVQTYADLATTYPNPQVGWTVQVYDTGERFRHDGIDWIAVDLFGGALPNANETIDGLMSKEDFVKLKGINTKVVERVLVFVIPSYLNVGKQGIIARFPYDGKIVGVRAIVGNEGVSDTEIGLEKTSDMTSWINVLSNNLIIASNSHFDNSTSSISVADVTAGELFRLDIVSAGQNVQNLTVEVIIETI